MFKHATRRAIGLGILLLAGVIAMPVPAAAPQISIERKYVEISIAVDAAFKPIAGLFANCLAEGKAWADRMNNASSAEWRDNRASFRDGLQWTYDRDYALRSVVGRYVSVVRSDGTFEGGAHPNQEIDTILWDSVMQKRISIRPFFTETSDNGPTMTALARLARLAVASTKLANGISGYDDDDTAAAKPTPEGELQHDKFINDSIKPALLQIGPVTLAPSTQSGKSAGLTFHYSPYAVGPYVEGPYTVFVAWTAFQQYLSDDGKTLFGGTRLPADEKDWQ